MLLTAKTSPLQEKAFLTVRAQLGGIGNNFRVMLLTDFAKLKAKIYL